MSIRLDHIAGGAPGGIPADGYDEEGDCNANGIPDDQDIAEGTSQDCNGNDTPDECESDCDGNAVPDDCDDVSSGTCCGSEGCIEATQCECEELDLGAYMGDGTVCLGDGDGDGIDDACEEAIPTVSEWGLIIMTLLALTAGTIVFARRRGPAAA